VRNGCLICATFHGNCRHPLGSLGGFCEQVPASFCNTAFGIWDRLSRLVGGLLPVLRKKETKTPVGVNSPPFEPYQLAAAPPVYRQGQATRLQGYLGYGRLGGLARIDLLKVTSLLKAAHRLRSFFSGYASPVNRQDLISEAEPAGADCVRGNHGTEDRLPQSRWPMHGEVEF
jgi:hypothetical protein